MSDNTTEVKYISRKGWELALGACAVCIPTLFVVLMTFASYIATGVYGATTVLAGTIITGSRILDGFTDPIIALFSDGFMSRFGRVRPLLVIGFLITSFACILMYVMCPGQGSVVVFALIYILYIIGYTIYGIAQNMIPTIMTNSPKQRPIFNRWATTYTTIISNCLSIVLAATLMPKHNYTYGLPLFADLCWLIIGISAVMVALSVVAISHTGVDVAETFVGKTKEKVKYRDMFSLIKGTVPCRCTSSPQLPTSSPCRREASPPSTSWSSASCWAATPS